ncbi:hypothetical protein [Amycolatopsis sp. NPDC051128]|uniref:hypothetical protein n=1 Tax=Amycolatopsis sp. NPDC051128 TaxID=3155412 RepID=UPI0034464D18
MRNAHPSRRQVEMAAVGLDFDYFADTTGLAGDGLAGEDFGGVAELFAEIAEIDAVVAELELIEAELLEHEVREASGAEEMARVIKLRLSEIAGTRAMDLGEVA